MTNTQKWTDRFLGLARHIATWSEDQSTKVGAVVVDAENTILSLGFNGLPRGVENTPYRNDRPQKYLYYEHSERNAIYNAARSGHPLTGSTIYVAGLFPCADCARAIIQAGIECVITDQRPDLANEKWGESFVASLAMLSEAGVIVHSYNGSTFVDEKPHKLRTENGSDLRDLRAGGANG